MTQDELYMSDVEAPLCVDLGNGLYKVYFNKGTETVARQSEDGDDATEEETVHTAWHADVKPEYGEIIAGIVRSKYSQDDVEALLCNHVAGIDDDKYDAFVAWRQMAHDVAKEVVAALKK